MIMFGENLIFFANFQILPARKIEVLPPRKLKNQSIMIITHQKGPVNSIKMQKYTQKVGNIWLQHVQEQV